ncbi:MAG: SoxR reducing system RseC family protein [Candidatus Zapsychrus exili]|nr:SoxR reducing system RseC family protein [Candidatus Zapsychrus exili]
MIEHKGTIKNIENDTIKVFLEENYACSGCAAKKGCSLSENNIKEIDIIEKDKSYSVGDNVIVLMGQSMGFKAVLLGYIFPFFIVLFILVATLMITDNEVLAATISILATAPYYIGLFLLKDKIKDQFSIRIKHL